MGYNHRRPLSNFQGSIDQMKLAGFNPIAVTQMYMEDTFVFETEDEATRAHEYFEVNNTGNLPIRISGWWYGRDYFMQTLKEYESKFDTALVYWL